MRLSHIIGVALAAVFIISGTGQVGAEEPDKLTCKQQRESMLTAEGVAYDVPGGGKFAHLSPRTKYVAATSLRLTDGERWLLLTGPGGCPHWLDQSNSGEAHLSWSRLLITNSGLILETQVDRNSFR